MSKRICLGAAAACVLLISPTHGSAFSQAPFELTCGLAEQTTITTTWDAGDRSSSRRTQRYRIDPGARSITAALSYDRGSQGWVERARLFDSGISVSADQVAFCEADSGVACNQTRTRTQSSGHVVEEFMTPTVIDLRTGRLSRESRMQRTASNGSRISLVTTTDGQCRR